MLFYSVGCRIGGRGEPRSRTLAVLFACAAGASMPVTALHAQGDDADRLSLEEAAHVQLIGSPGGSFGPRVDTLVYGAAVDLRGYSDGGFPKLSGDDVDFAGGPAGAMDFVTLNKAYYAVVMPVGATLTATDVRFSFYDVFNGWVVGSFPGSQLIGLRGVSPIWNSPDAPAQFDLPIVIPSNQAGSDCFVTIETLLPGTTLPHPTNWVVTGGPDLLVGSSDPQRWGDSNSDRLVQIPELNSVGSTRRLYMGFYSASLEQPGCNDIDFNNDGSSPQLQDLDAFLSVFSEAACIPANATCDDIDFNNDGSYFDPCDVASFIVAFSEGPCTPCGQ